MQHKSSKESNMVLHPASVHFAIALPLVASLIGVLYVLTRNKGLSTLSLWATFLAAVAMGIAWYTGSEAGPQIYDFLSDEAKAELLEHKQLGFYLALALSAIFLLQIAGAKMKNFIIEALAIALLLGATLVTFVQGNDGGELVYEHGMPFKSHLMEEFINDALLSAQETESADEKVEIYEEAIENINMHSKEVNTLYSRPVNQEAE